MKIFYTLLLMFVFCINTAHAHWTTDNPSNWSDMKSLKAIAKVGSECEREVQRLSKENQNHEPDSNINNKKHTCEKLKEAFLNIKSRPSVPKSPTEKN